MLCRYVDKRSCLHNVGPSCCCVYVSSQRSLSSHDVNLTFSKVQLKGRIIFIKRDDMFFNHGVNGNKARKFHQFGSMSPFPEEVYRL
jgi:hypothetical protein